METLRHAQRGRADPSGAEAVPAVRYAGRPRVRAVPVDVALGLGHDFARIPVLDETPGGVLQRCGATPCGCSEHDDTPVMCQRSLGSADPSALPLIVRDVLPASGRPLDPGARAFFEPRFGNDFGAVRVHTDEPAARAAEAINASAFTVGSSIWFGRGKYQPETMSGRRLLAHELTHTIQQRGRPTAQRSLRIGAASDPAEATADRAADAVLSGRSIPDIGTGGPIVRRAPTVTPVQNEPTLRDVVMDDKTHYRVRQINRPEQKTVEKGEDSGPTADVKLDKDNAWLQVDFCVRGNHDTHGTVKIGTDLPAQAIQELQTIGDAIKNGTLSPAEAIREANVGAFASVSVIRSSQFSVDISGGPTFQPFGPTKVTGGQGQIDVNTGRGWGAWIHGDVSESPGSHRSDVTITGGLKFDLERPREVKCMRTIVTPDVSYTCEQITPAHDDPQTRPDRRPHTFYFDYPSAKPASTGRTHALDVEAQCHLRKDLADGYRVVSIVGFASPEGPVPPTKAYERDPTKGFEGNKVLSEKRANAAREWIAANCPPSSPLAMRPGCLDEDAVISGDGEKYGADPTGRELVGRELAVASVKGFQESDVERSRRTPEVEKEIAAGKTPERQTDTVWPLLRRAEIIVSKQVPGDPKHVPEQSAPVDCPPAVRSAAADDFTRKQPEKK